MKIHRTVNIRSDDIFPVGKEDNNISITTRACTNAKTELANRWLKIIEEKACPSSVSDCGLGQLAIIIAAPV